MTMTNNAPEMNAADTETNDLLKTLGEWWDGGLAFADGKTLEEVWLTCENGHWLMWLMAKQISKPNWPTHKELVLVACACAETVAHLDKTGAATKCISVTRRWAAGKATTEEVRVASQAAYDVFESAYYFGDAAADAIVDAAADSARAAYFAAAAVDAAPAVDAADDEPEASAAYCAARKNPSLELCKVIRSMVTIPY